MVFAEDPNTKFSAQRKFTPEGERTVNKRQKQKIKDGGGGQGKETSEGEQGFCTRGLRTPSGYKCHL